MDRVMGPAYGSSDGPKSATTLSRDAAKLEIFEERLLVQQASRALVVPSGH